MKTIYRIMTLCLLLMLSMAAEAEILKGTLRIGDKDMPAEFLKLSENTVSVGNGRNACVSQLKSSGTLTIPSQVTIDGKQYNVTEINRFAFRFCNFITGVNIQENVEKIGDFAFIGSSGIKEITLPMSLKSLGCSAFASCYDALETVTCLSELPPVWERDDVFRWVTDPEHIMYSDRIKLFVPASDNYINADGWKLFADLKFGEAVYRAYDEVDLILLRERVNMGNERAPISKVVLENDIDMSGVKWTGGIGKSEVEPFLGDFDGQGHTIYNMTIEGSDYPAFFSHFGGRNIRNVIFRDCNIINNNVLGNAAVVVNESGKLAMDDVWLENCHVSGGRYLGGLIAYSLSAATQIADCIVKDISFYPNNNTTSRTGALMGIASGGSAYRCAVIGKYTPRNDASVESPTYRPFLGMCRDNDAFYIHNSLCSPDMFIGFTEDENILYDADVLMSGRVLNITDVDGTSKEVTLNDANIQSLLSAPVLGDFWVFSEGEYPLPYGYKRKFPVKPNKAVYAFQPFYYDEVLPVNCLLASSARTKDFLDLSPNGYVSKTYKATSVWIDDNFRSGIGQLPIGTATIICTDGVKYDRVLRSDVTYKSTMEAQVIDVDKDGDVALTQYGEFVVFDEVQVLDEGEVYLHKGYNVCLPYDLRVNGSARVYEPIGFGGEGDVITAYMTETNMIEAWKPCIVAVAQDSLPLGTTSQVIFRPKKADSDFKLLGGNYGMVGLGELTSADSKLYYELNDDEIWRHATSAELLPFRSYFTVEEGKGSEEFTTGMGFRADLVDDSLVFRWGMPVYDISLKWWLLSYNNPNSVPQWAGDAKDIVCARFDESFTTARPTSMRAWFQNCQKLTALKGMEYLNTSETKDMAFMFSACTALKELDLSRFDTHKLWNTSNMFEECIKLEKVVIGKDWTMTPVSVSDRMFYNCISIEGQFNTSYFENNIDKNAANATNFGYLWKIYPYYIVTLANSSTIVFEGSDTPADGYNTYDALDTGDEEPGWKRYLDIPITTVNFSPSFTFARPKSCYKWFASENITAIGGLDRLNTSQVTNMASMFEGCQATKLNVSTFDTHHVTDMSAMFKDCSKLTQLNVSGFNTALVGSMEDMFAGCAKLESVDVSGFKTFNTRSMKGMFQGCEALTEVDVNNFNVSELSNTAFMFAGNSSLRTILSETGWSDISESTDMFASCENLEGAVKYESSKVNGDMANPETGYFTASPTIMLQDRGDNSKLFAEYDGKVVNVKYDRVLSAIEEKDGTWSCRAYTICLPYDLNLVRPLVDGKVSIFQFCGMNDDNELLFTENRDGGLLVAGRAYLVVVNYFELDLNASRVVFTATPSEGVDVTYDSDDPSKNGQVVGKWRGIFTDQTNDWAVSNHAYGLSSRGTWERYSNASEPYSSFFPYAFRSYFFANEPTGIGSYPMVYCPSHTSGIYSFTPIKSFDGDIGVFDPTGINTIHVITGEGNHEYYDLQGRPLPGPPAKGIYIQDGVKKFAK